MTCSTRQSLETDRSNARTSRDAVRQRWAALDSCTADIARGEAAYAALAASTALLDHIGRCPECRGLSAVHAAREARGASTRRA